MLSSFAISVAANIVTSYFARNDTEKEIRKAFQDAIELWCPNEDIRRFKEKEINGFVQNYISNPAIDEKRLSEEQKEFLECFEKCVAKYHSAALYLSAIKGRDNYEMVMASLDSVHAKLDSITQKLDKANPRDEDLHFEAVVEINTILRDVVEAPVNALLYGILAEFDDDIFAYTDVRDGQNIEILIDKDSRLVEDEDGECSRPKFHDFDYDWDKELRPDWTQMNPDLDFAELFGDSYIAGFQLMGLDFSEGIAELQLYIDRKSINDQLSTDEKRQLNEIIANMRALQSMLENNTGLFTKVPECFFKNLEIKQERLFTDHGRKIGEYAIVYNDGEYNEVITGLIAPVKTKDKLLDVFLIMPEYIFKLTGYLGALFDSVVEWWKITSRGNTQRV